MIYSKYINPYLNKILNNEINHNIEQELMVKNILIPVLNRDDVFFDEKKVEKGLSLQKYFPFELIDWEKMMFACIAGLFIKFDDGYIDVFFKEIDMIVGRGAGKNGFISFLCFYFLSQYHGVKNYNIDIIANSEEQAKTSFMDVYEIVNSDEYKRKLEKHYKANLEKIKGLKTDSILKYLTSSAKAKDSKRSGCVIHDEKHEYMKNENINTLKSGLGKVQFGREITITSDGLTRGGVLDKDKEKFKEILKKYDPNNRRLIFWCRIESEEEYKDSRNWIKANPSINDFPILKNTIQLEVNDMKYTPDYYYEFMAKRMNYPIGTGVNEVASWEDITSCNRKLIDLQGCSCVGGIDLAKKDDFIGCVLVFYKNNTYYVIHHTFVCTHSRDLTGIQPDLHEWEKQGQLTFINDVEIDPEIIANWFYEKSLIYNIKKIAIDYYRARMMKEALEKIGYDAYKKKNIKLIRPSDIMLIAPIINSAFVKHSIVWGENSIMCWFTNNTKKVMDGKGNILYEKIEEHYRKTDTFMAFVAAMCISEEITSEKTIIDFSTVNNFLKAY